MSALAILAIVAGVLLAAVVAIGVAAAVRTQAARGRDLALAEALAGEEREATVSPEILEQRGILERATFRWERLDPEVQESLALRAARRWGEEPEELGSYINALIRTGRRPHAGVLLRGMEPEPLGVEPDPVSAALLRFEPPPASTVAWYRDQLLSLHPAYLATNASLLERVTQLITLTIRVERGGEIPQRRRYPLNPRNPR